MSDNVCCPVFDPVPWDEKAHNWEGKAFLTATVKQFFHMPLPGNYGRTIAKLQKEAKDNGIMPDEKNIMLLSFDISPWKSELYFAVTGEKPGVATTKLSGEYISKTFDGPYNNMSQYIDEFEDFAHAMHKKLGKYFFWYTTCPKCARKYGHNYIVVLGEVAA
jgi:effector-binding domain-containing protein